MTFNRITAYIMVGAAALIVAMGVYINHLQSMGHSLALRIYNDSAALDTSRRVILSKRDSIKYLGDSLQAVTKLATQTTQQRDWLDRALRAERKVTVGLGVTIDQLKANQVASTAPVVASTAGDTLSATFHVERPLWTADAAVKLPRVGAGALDLAVTVRPMRLGLRASCEKANADGIRPARFSATSGAGIAVAIDSASVDPEVCQNQVAQSTKWYRAFRPEIAAGYGYAFSADSANTVKARRALFLGIVFWHWPK